jgi:hypothetical protein
MTNTSKLIKKPVLIGNKRATQLRALSTKNSEKENLQQQLQRTSLDVALASLWNSRQFSAKEKNTFKKLIAEHFDANKSVKKQFIEIVERICLAKRYVFRKRGRYVSKPIDWLNVHYKNGLSGTATWLQEVKEQRKTAPEYNKGITAFAKAIYDYSINPSAYTFYKHRRILITQGQADLLQLFYSTIIYKQFLN